MPYTQLEKSQILEEIVRFSSRGISDISMEELHELARFTEVINESQQLVAIYTGPDKPVQPLIDHMKGRLAEFGIRDGAVHVQDYTDKFGTPQQNLVVELAKGDKNGEMVVISGHSDTVGADMKKFSISPENGKLYVGRMEIKKNADEEPSVYGVGMCDMKNIFGVVMQIAKESHLAGTPQLYVQERSWLNGVDANAWGRYKSWLEQKLAEGRIADVLSKSKNRLVLAVTSGEESAGHEGIKKTLEYNLAGVNNADLWIMPEPSKGLVDTHKGYAATKIEISKNVSIDEVTYNPNEQALRLVDALRRRHSEKMLVKPHYIEDDRLGLPTHNVGIIRGFMDDLGEKYLEVRFTGKGGHSSKPIEGGHPVECAAYFYNALKRIYGNNVELVLLNGGQDRNVIPQYVNLGIKVISKEYGAGFFGRMLDFATLALDDFKKCEMEIAVNNSSGLDEALSGMAMRDRINVNSTSPDRSQKKQHTIIENDYRIVPGQVPDSLAESVQEIAGGLGIDAKVTLTRDSYPFPSRYLQLNRELQDGLLAAMGQSKCEGADFSTEAGTLASRLPNVVPIVMSTTNIDQAHKQDNEYVTLKALREQVRIFNELMPTLLNSPVKSPHGARITASETELFIRRMRDQHEIPEKEFREHLGWFREWGIFAVIYVGKEYMGDRKEIRRLEACISDFSRFLGIYPVLVMDGTEDFAGKNFSRQAFRYEIMSPGADFSTRFIATAAQAVKRGEIPIIVNEGSQNGSYSFANEVVKALKPLKYVVLTPKAVYDSHGSLVHRIEFSKLLSEPVFGEPLSTDGLATKLKVNSLRADSYKILQTAYNHLVSFGDEKIAKRRAVQFASLDSLMAELFSVAGRGTLMRLGYEIVEADSFNSVDMPRLKELLESIYEGTLSPNYFKRRGANVRKIFVEKDYDGVAVLASPSHLEPEFSGRILHLDKIGVRDDFWRQHLPEALMEMIFSTADMICWRDFEGSTISEWSPRLVDYARYKDRWTSSETLQHRTGRQMEAYFIGFNPYSQRDVQARALLNSEIRRMPHSFSYR